MSQTKLQTATSKPTTLGETFMLTRLVAFVGLGIALTALSGCPSPAACKPGSLFVTATMPTPSDTDLTIDVLVDGSSDFNQTLPNTAGKPTGSVEVDFKSGYPQGKNVTVVVTGTSGGMPMTLLGAADLTQACATLTLTVGDPPDLSSNPNAPDMATNPNLHCGTGTHGCGQQCVANTSTDFCGVTSCTPCPTPAHGTTICDGIQCTATCEPGYNSCSGDCKAPDDPTACGNTCVACMVPANASAATCDAGHCGFTCKPGFHACGDSCVDNTSINNCGSVSCTACISPTGSGGKASCDGTKCSASCPDASLPQLCNGACIAAGAPCTNMCSDTTTHACGGLCVPKNDLNNCGSLCNMPCPTDPNGTTGCDGTSCTLVCGGAYHKCGNTCVANKSQSSCGTTAAACSNSCTTTLANAVSTCTSDGAGGYSCALGCVANYHSCINPATSMTACVANTDPAYGCGNPGCGTCPVPANGSNASCSGSQCSFSCNAGFHKCGSACNDNSNVNSCGANCGPCATTGLPANSAAACVASGSSFVCSYKCDNGYVNCGGVCVAANDPAHGCGTCGAACSTPSGGNADCIGSGVCDYTCSSGTKCNGGCFDSTQPTSCGPSCQTCTAPSGGSVSCNGTSCVPSCPGGTTLCASTNSCNATGSPCNGSCPGGSHVCGGVCVPDTSTTQCGASCADCTTANASVVCSGGSCVITGCAAGFHQCNGAGPCFSDADTGHCGGACTACPGAPPNATEVCSGGTCQVQCNGGTTACGGACITGCCSASDCAGQSNAAATCTVSNSVGTCSYNCINGYTNCGTGCNVILGTNSNCAACGNKCTGTNDCQGGRCAFDCDLCSPSLQCCTPIDEPTACHTCTGPCFVAGTPVTMGDGSHKAIEDVAVGDSVRAYDEASGEVRVAMVAKTFVHPDTHEFVTLMDGLIVTTPEHPFFVDGAWKPAGELQAGDFITHFGPDGLTRVSVGHIARMSGSETTYNLNVDGYHTYFVDDILVHNKIQP